MAIFYGLNSDNYSSFFNGFSSSGSSSTASGLGLYGSLGDYGLIQKGGYKKLCKSYYAKENASSSDSTNSTTSTKDEAAKNTEVADSAVALKKSANSLSKLDFTKENANKLDAGVKDFVNSYNSMISKAEDSKTNSITGVAKHLTNYTKANEKALKSIGITIGSDNKLSINTDTLSKAGVSELKGLFRGSSSFAGRVSAYATSLYTTAVASDSSLYSNKGSIKNLNMSSLYETYL